MRALADEMPDWALEVPNWALQVPDWALLFVQESLKTLLSQKNSGVKPYIVIMF